MTLSWTAGQAFNSVAYYVTVIRPSGATVTSRTASQSIDFLDAEVGLWTFVVTAIGLNGKSSLPAQTTYTLAGWAGQAATTVAGLSVKGGGSTFSGRSCTVTWANQIAATVPPYPVRNAVYVFDASTQALVHREVLPAGVTEWTYDYLLNVNEGGPRRQFRVGVTAYSAAGDEGPPSYLTVANPPPAGITPTLGATSEVLFVNLPPVTDPDFAGYLVWVSETAGINPLTAKSYEVTGSQFTFAGTPNKTYYVRVAAFDAFSKNPAELNVSAEQSRAITILLFDPLAPAIPGQPTLASNATEVAPDGTVTAKIIVAWPAVTSDNLGFYEVAVAEGSNPPDSAYGRSQFVSGTLATFAGLMPGRVYSFKIRTQPLKGFAVSGWSPVLVVTAAPSAVAPANPTNVSISAAFERVLISFTPPANKDLAYVEVWAAGGTFTDTAPISGATQVGRVPYGSATFWDSLSTGGIRTYWLRSVNTSGVTATSYVRAGSATPPQIQAGALAAGIIDATKLASGLDVPTRVAALPTTKGAQLVLLESDGKLYRWDATQAKYVSVGLTSAEITGLTASQITSVNAAAIAGQVQAAQLAAIEASKVTGQMSSDQIGALAATKITGQLTSDQIAGLNAAKIAGQLADTQIASVSALKVSGALVNATLAAGSLTGKITETQISDNSIATPMLKAGAVTTAALAANAVTAGKVDAGAITAREILAGTITGTQLAADAVTAGKIAAGAVVAGNIAAGAIVASKLSIGSAAANLCLGGDMEEVANGLPVGWSSLASNTSAGSTIAAYTGAVQSGTTALLLSKATNDANSQVAAISSRMPVEALATYECLSYVAAVSATGTTVGFTVWAFFYDKTDTYLTTIALSSNGPVANGAFSRRAYQVQAPSTAAYARLAFLNGASSTAQYVVVDSVVFRRAGGVTSIENGSITTPKLVADAITANELAANAVVTRNVQAGAIVTAHMTAGSINADRLTAQSITAGLIAASTITGDKIAGRTIVAGNLVAGTITGVEIKAGSVNADRLEANSITASQIAAGAIKADQLDVGAVTAGKIGVGLTSGNLVWNSDVALDGWYGFATNQAGATCTRRDQSQAYNVNGTKASIQLWCANATANNFAYFDLWYPNADNSPNALIPVQSGKQYEFTAYLSTHRCSGRIEIQWYDGTNFLPGVASLPLTNQPLSGTPSDTWRARIMATAPATAKFAALRVVQTYSGGTEAYVMASGFYFGVVPTGTPATAFSDYAPQSATIITGAGISTNSLHANKIMAGSITADQIAAGSITVDRLNATELTTRIINTDGLKASNITISGFTKLASWAIGTEINGGSISAGTVTAMKLSIQSRPMTVVGIDMQMQRDANGALTGWIVWTSGFISILNTSGGYDGYAINAGSLYTGFTETHIWWNIGWADLAGARGGANLPIGADKIPWASYTNAAGLTVMKGGTIIDGTRIVTGSIQAGQIAANQIQTQHMAANSIQGDRILAGSLAVDRIAAGTISAGAILVGPASGNGSLVMEAPANRSGRLYCRDLNGTLRGMFGYIGDFSGVANDFGLLMWNAAGTPILTTSGLGANTVSDVQVSSLSANKIAVTSLSAFSANLGEVTTGVMRSPNSKTVFDLTNGRLLISD